MPRGARALLHAAAAASLGSDDGAATTHEELGERRARRIAHNLARRGEQLGDEAKGGPHRLERIAAATGARACAAHGMART